MYKKIALVALFILLGKATGLAKDMLLAYFEGTSATTDAFFLASAVSGLLVAGVYSAIPIAVVPLYVRLRGETGRESDLLGVVLFSLGWAVAAFLLVMFFGEYLLSLVAESSPSVIIEANGYLRVMAFGFMFLTLVSVANSLQAVNGEWVPSYVVPIVNNLFFCISILLVREKGDFSIVVTAGVVAWVVLFIYGIPSLRLALGAAKGLNITKENFLAVISIMAPALLVIYVEQMYVYVGTYFASGLDGHAITLWSYAGKLSLLFTSVFLVYLTTQIFPKLAGLAGNSDLSDLFSYIVKCFRLVGFFLAPVLIYLCVYANDLVALLFGRGRFDKNDQIAVAALLSILLLGVPFSIFRDLLNRASFAIGARAMSQGALVFSLLVNFGVGAVLSRKLGLLGVAWALVIATAANVLVLSVMLVRRFRLNPFWSVSRSLFGYTFSGLLASVPIFYVNGIDGVWWFAWFPFAVFYLAILHIAGFPEPKMAWLMAIDMFEKSGLRFR